MGYHGWYPLINRLGLNALENWGNSGIDQKTIRRKKLKRKLRKQAIHNYQNVVIYFCSNILFQILSFKFRFDYVCFLNYISQVRTNS